MKQTKIQPNPRLDAVEGALRQRAAKYYDQNKGNIEQLLVSSGISKETAERVLRDYSELLGGNSNTEWLTIEQQVEVVNKIKPWRALMADRYGLFLLLAIYVHNVEACKEYIELFKLANGHVWKNKGELYQEETIVPVKDQKQDFLDTVTRRIVKNVKPLYVLGYEWVRTHGIELDGIMADIITAKDFEGVNPECSSRFFATITTYAEINGYINYYFLAKYALSATEEELREIPTPSAFRTQDEAIEYAEVWSLTRCQNLQSKEAEIVQALEAAIFGDTEQERESAKKKVAETKPQDTVRVPETFALLGSRPVYASVDGTEKMTKGILPIQAVITDYMKRHNLTEQVSPRAVDKVIEAINALYWIKKVTREGRYYILETNISEFSGLCGYNDANDEQKKEIRQAIGVLDGLFLAVWRSEGLKAIRVFTLEEVGLEGKTKGSLLFKVNADVMKGRPNLVSFNDFSAMCKSAKGQAQNRFRNQIIGKGNKEEKALLDEVFGYAETIDCIRETGGSEEELTKAKRTIMKHKSRDKQKIAKWFEEYKQNGWLVQYSRTKNAKGEFVYRWKRGNVPQE